MCLSDGSTDRQLKWKARIKFCNSEIFGALGTIAGLTLTYFRRAIRFNVDLNGFVGDHEAVKFTGKRKTVRRTFRENANFRNDRAATDVPADNGVTQVAFTKAFLAFERNVEQFRLLNGLLGDVRTVARKQHENYEMTKVQSSVTCLCHGSKRSWARSVAELTAIFTT